MDDVGNVVRNPERGRVAEIAPDQRNPGAVEEVEVGRRPDEADHLPACGRQVPAEAGADKSVGPGHEHFIHETPNTIRRSARRFQARTINGPARMANIPRATPAAESMT